MDSLNMQLPRGWYQVAGLTPHTFRRHCLSSKSGVLELSFLDPESSSQSGEETMGLLTQILERQDIHVGAAIKSGYEECAAGMMAYGVYKHIGGQREYWIIPHEEATVFACWQMGAVATAGMERQDIHRMLKQLHFEHEEEAQPETEAESEVEIGGELGGAEAAEEQEFVSGESDVYVVINDVEAEVEAQHKSA